MLILNVKHDAISDAVVSYCDTPSSSSIYIGLAPFVRFVVDVVERRLCRQLQNIYMILRNIPTRCGL